MADENMGSSQDPNTSSSGKNMSASGTTMKSGSVLGKLENVLNEWMVVKAPFQLPVNVKEIVVKLAPWLTLILALLALPVVLAALGLTAAFTPFAMMGGYTWAGLGFVTMLFTIASLLLELAAVPGLFHRTRRGWNLVFYATLISLVGSLVSLNIIGGIIGAVIGWYFLFQVREMYH